MLTWLPFTDGSIPLRLAENSLVHEDIVAFIQEQVCFCP